MKGQVLGEAAAQQALNEILSGEVPDAQAAAFLTAVQMRGIHPSELKGFFRELDVRGIKVDLQEKNMIDVCGTGGDDKGTFNISTLTAFVLAGAGVKVAKHGNSSATSGCGSSDILAFLGVKFTADEGKLRSDLSHANICYLHAPLFQPGLKQVAPLRKEIGFRTFFNLLGPLVNPARPRHRFIGVADPAVLRLYRYFFEDGETSFAVVHSRGTSSGGANSGGYDEISLTGPFDAATNFGMETYYPDDLGFETAEADELYGGANLQEAADKFVNILRGGATSKTQRDVVIANAAFAMRLVKPELSLAESREKAEASLNSGAAFRSFEYLCSN
jgi:anthranilate phosphoribosyltransferase